MTGKELREIEAREKAATPGPWMTEKPDDDALDARPAVVGEKRRTRVGTERPIIVNDAWAPDAVFIAAARSDIPALCAEVRRLVKVIDDLRKHHRAIARDPHLQGYGYNETGIMLDRALEGYEVDDG